MLRYVAVSRSTVEPTGLVALPSRITRPSETATSYTRARRGSRLLTLSVGSQVEHVSMPGWCVELVLDCEQGSIDLPDLPNSPHLADRHAQPQ